MEDTQNDLEKKSYEVSFLSESEDKVSDVRRLIGQYGIDVVQEFPEKKINLSYPINKVTQALFVALKVLSEPDKIKLLEKDLNSSKSVLRSLIITTPKTRVVRGDTAQKPVTPARRTGVPTREPREPREPRVKPLSNEAIEKKIEEILQ